ncbi:MAG TPA: hypothetical protein VN808_16585, partial [Stellaceae bacterium]|nr:hypothetical protein [Stellaceae bacterium]
RPYVSLIWCSTPSGHGNGLRPWIQTNRRRTAYEPLNLTLDFEHAHVNGRSLRHYRTAEIDPYGPFAATPAERRGGQEASIRTSMSKEAAAVEKKGLKPSTLTWARLSLR